MLWITMWGCTRGSSACWSPQRIDLETQTETIRTCGKAATEAYRLIKNSACIDHEDSISVYCMASQSLSCCCSSTASDCLSSVDSSTPSCMPCFSESTVSVCLFSINSVELIFCSSILSVWNSFLVFYHSFIGLRSLISTSLTRSVTVALQSAHLWMAVPHPWSLEVMPCLTLPWQVPWTGHGDCPPAIL